jgi:serine/threonine protein kinase
MAGMSVAKQAFGDEGDDHGGPPRSLGRYRIGERIGSGGTADVFRAEVEGASGFAKTLVVKCLRAALADEPELAQGLAREAKLAQRLHHGNIVQVLDFGIEDDRPYVVMEHVDGCSLHELAADLRRRGERMGLPEALFVVEEVAAALRYAHGLVDEQGVPLRLVHRDVKPRNVLVSREGVVKLTDFGIAKLADDHGDTLPGVIKGTPLWLAPEQALGRGVDARTDVFALGLLLRELVSDDERADALPDAHVNDALREVWRRASAEAPDERFPDVQSMLRALQRWRAARELDAGPGQLAAWVRRARQQAPLARPMTLDAALLGTGERDVTVTSTAGPIGGSAPQVEARRRSRRIALVGVLALGGGALVVWASAQPPAASDAAPAASSEPSAPPELAASPEPSTSSRRTASPEPPASPQRTASPPPSPAAEPFTSPPAAEPGHRRTPSREAEPGRLRVNVLPWAEVSVDGRPRGRVPVDVELSAGRHRVRLWNPQLGERILEIEVPTAGVHTISEW